MVTLGKAGCDCGEVELLKVREDVCGGTEARVDVSYAQGQLQVSWLGRV